MSIFPPSFSRFLLHSCDRSQFIQNYLSERGVESFLIPVEGKKHIFVKLNSLAYNPMFHIKTVLAHYDRVDGSPGANDNSAAVFCLMDFAVRLSRRSGMHNIRIFFTDGEEIGYGGVCSQGAFGLAALLKKLGITQDDVYVFDCMGRGTIPVLAKTTLPPGVSSGFKKRFSELEERTRDILRSLSPQKWLELPVRYSDNAGFLACGIPAVALTMLPVEEAERYMLNLFSCDTLEKSVQNCISAADSALNEQHHDLIPETWKLLHTALDDEDSLTAESFALTAKILDALAGMRIIA